MKHLKTTLLALFALVCVNNVNAQDENNPWAISIGTNVIDFYNSDDFGTQIKDLLGNKDWNLLPSVTRISAEKYLEKGFSLQLAGSLNKIENYTTLNDADDLYWSIDAAAKYDLNTLIGETAWFDPFVFLGGSYVSYSNEGEAMLHGGVGFNAWFNENIGLNFQTGTKKGFTDNVKTHYQTNFGLVLRFGGKDTDKDGVYDKEDACPEVAGLAQFNGCPDADNDGVKDADDACPNVAGIAALNGCPDADGDGIADKDDMCVNAKGTKANNGCPDTDGDSVVDKDDKCPSVAGPAANAGCPWPDTDKDGILDKDDKCINVAGVASNNGCPEPVIVKEAEEAIKLAAKTILFNSGKSSFKAGVTKKLDEIVSLMNKFSKANFAIEGHTDSAGRDSFNQMISEKRANAVKNYLVKKGIASSRLTAKGYGETKPIASNKTNAGKAANRRVEIKITNK